MSSRRAPATRIWTRLTLVASAAALVASAAAFLLDVPAVVGWNIAWTAAAVAGVTGSLAAWASASPESRRRWTWWTAACACWLVGQLVWDWYGSAVPDSPNLADAGWWAFAILMIAGLLDVPGRSRGLRWIAVVEGLPLIVAVMTLTCAWLWTEVGASDLPIPARVTTLLYPVLYVSAAVLTLQAMVAGPLRAAREPGSRLVFAGVVATAVAFILWSPLLLAGRFAAGETLIDPVWVAGMLLIGAGGVVAGRKHGQLAPHRDEPGRRGGLLPAALFLILVAALMRAEVAGEPLGARLALVAGLLICGAMLIARGVLLAARLRGLLDRERFARRELAGRETELAELNERLAEDSRRDPLTGLLNRRALASDVPSGPATGLAEPIALALCDVDRFKSYNDRLGHLAGDQALRSLADIVRGALRSGDAAYRYGGEELLLVLRNADPAEAVAAAERVRAAVAGAAIAHPDGLGGVLTVSIGVAAGPPDLPTLLADADSALYEAKAGGRNRVVGPAPAKERWGVGRRRAGLEDDPVVRHLRGVLAIGRAAATGRGAHAVAEALAGAIRAELRFELVAVNLYDRGHDELYAAVVLGDDDARAALEGSRQPLAHWLPLLDPRHERCGALWLPAGAYDARTDPHVWISPAPAASDLDSWQPEDLLFLPLRASTGDLLGVVSVDRPLSGRRPDDREISVLATVAEHAAVALEHTQREHALLGASHGLPEHRLAAVTLMAETLDLRDSGTSRHSHTVGTYAREIAAALGVPEGRIERIRAAGVLHDLGKLGIADAVLHKAGPLDEDEWREMKRHPEIGARILDHAGLADIAAWVKAHHERPDGRGYPLGLAADEIPLEARILAVADAYEAMTADRPYRRALPAAAADAELRANAGTQFDPVVVDAFLTRETASRSSRPAGRPLSRLG